MRVGSLCTGIAGAERALDLMGLQPDLKWYAEVDKDAVRVLAQRLPGVPNLGDLTKVEWESVEPVELLVAGYPCQGESTAGKRMGADDERWIWPDIAKCLRVLRPRIALFENVSAHLSGTFWRVLCDLAALGFDVEWSTVRASDVGACHQRDRVFIAATDPSGDESERWGGARNMVGSERERERAKGRNGNGFGTPLSIAVQMLPTPRATDHKGGSPNRAGGGHSLPDLTQLLPTPQVSGGGAGAQSNSKPTQPNE